MTTTCPPTTAVADRFRCEAEVPDPPKDAAGRKQYWEDTVTEAVAELRKRLLSASDERSLAALKMIVDLEKARMRHKEPVAGTKVPPVPYVSPLSPLPPLRDDARDGAPMKPAAKKDDLTPPATVAASRDREGAGSSPQTPLPRGRGSQDHDPPPKPARPLPTSVRVKLQDGVHCHFHDHDDDWMLEADPDRTYFPVPGGAQ